MTLSTVNKSVANIGQTMVKISTSSAKSVDGQTVLPQDFTAGDSLQYYSPSRFYPYDFHSLFSTETHSRALRKPAGQLTKDYSSDRE